MIIDSLILTVLLFIFVPKRLTSLIIIILAVNLFYFMAGLIHPYVLLISWSLMLSVFGFAAFSLTVAFRELKSFILILVKKENRTKNFGRLVSSLALTYLMLLSFACAGDISSFVGLRMHYSFVKDYDKIRIWAQNVELSPEGNVIAMNGINIPEPAKSFNPEDVSIEVYQGKRRLTLSWGSGLMEVSWALIICEPDDIYSNQRGILAEMQPGVYLHFERGS